MTVTPAQLVEVWVPVLRLLSVVEVLRQALSSEDLLTARYAAAAITQLSDQVETTLLDLDRDVKVTRTEVRNGAELAIPQG